MAQEKHEQGLISWPNTQNLLSRFKKSTSFLPYLWDDFLSELDDLGPDQGKGLTISEDKNHVFVEAAMPGLELNDIDVTFEKGILWIKGDKKEEEEDKEKKFYRKASSSFSYRLALPGQIDETKEPQATYKDGIMKVSFSKAHQSQIKKINVKNK